MRITSIRWPTQLVRMRAGETPDEARGVIIKTIGKKASKY